MDAGQLELTCSVVESDVRCPRPVKRLSYCYGHYMKNWRYGTPTPQHVFHEDVTGQRFGTVIALSHQGLGNWLCKCDCGAEVVKYLSGDLKRRTNPTCGDGKCRRSDFVTYSQMHSRLRKDYGPASRHRCVDCGSPALHWSYDHCDPNELYATEERITGIAYSANADHYVPRCVPCHKRYDLDKLNSTSSQ